jgi:hypothetical protein
MENQNRQRNRTIDGQTLIMLVVLMGGMLMMATAIAGLLTFFQLQQAGDASRSTIAIYAADAGIERAARFLEYEYMEDAQYDCTDENNPCTAALGTVFVNDPFRDPSENPVPIHFGVLSGLDVLPNGAEYEARIVVPSGSGSGVRTIISANGFDAGRRTVRSMQIIRVTSPISPSP